MMMAGPGELLLMLLMSMGGASADLATMLDPADYFKQRGVEVRLDKMMELAAADNKAGGNQIAQLLALRVLGDDPARLKNHEQYAAFRPILEAIAEGTKAQDKQGFAKDYARLALARIDGKQVMPAPIKAKWREEALAWFPSSTTLVFAMDTQGGQAPGAERDMQAMLAKLTQLIPVKERKKVYEVIDQLGNIQIQRVGVAFTDNAEKPREGEYMIRITGRAHQGQLIKVLTGLGLEAKEHKGRKGATYTMLTGGAVLGNDFPAILFVGDHDVVIAGVTGRGDPLSVLSKVLDVRDSNKGGVMEGELKADLKRVPDKATGFLVGRPPAEMRKGAPFPIPNKVFAHTQRAPKANDLQLEASFENGDQVKEFVQMVFRGRTSALEELKNGQGQPLPMPGFDLAPIQQLLESLQVEGKGDTAKMRLLIPDQTMATLPAFFLYSIGGRLDAPPPGKIEEKK